MSKTRDQIVEELDSKIPRDVVSSREGGGGKKLSYLEGHYVIDRLNKVLGQGRWSYDTEEMKLVHSGTGQDRFGKDVHTVHYIAKIRLQASFPDGSEAVFCDYGYGDGSDKQNIGKAHELAVKESITDGVKRCAKNLGMSMGLALYSKEQENVDDEPNKSSGPEKPVLRAVAQGPAPAEKPSETIARPPVPPAAAPSDSAVPAEAPTDREQLNKMLSSMSKVVLARKKATLDDIRQKMRSAYKTDKKEELTDDQAKEFYGTLRSMLNG